MLDVPRCQLVDAVSVDHAVSVQDCKCPDLGAPNHRCTCWPDLGFSAVETFQDSETVVVQAPVGHSSRLAVLDIVIVKITCLNFQCHPGFVVLHYRYHFSFQVDEK